MSRRELFYFVQREILLKKNRYKIGKSKSTKYERIKNYGAKCRILITLDDINNVKNFEKIIKKKLKKRFVLVGGNEYFEGCEFLMSNVIYQEYVKYKYNKEIQLKHINLNNSDVFYIS